MKTEASCGRLKRRRVSGAGLGTAIWVKGVMDGGSGDLRTELSFRTIPEASSSR